MFKNMLGASKWMEFLEKAIMKAKQNSKRKPLIIVSEKFKAYPSLETARVFGGMVCSIQCKACRY